MRHLLEMLFMRTYHVVFVGICILNTILFAYYPPVGRYHYVLTYQYLNFYLACTSHVIYPDYSLLTFDTFMLRAKKFGLFPSRSEHLMHISPQDLRRKIQAGRDCQK